MPSLSSYNDRVRRAYAGQEARRKLNDLRPCLRDDVTAFAASGWQATARSVKRWLAAKRGVSGAVDSYVAEILAHQLDAQSARAEFN